MAWTFAGSGDSHGLSTVHYHGHGTDGMAGSWGTVVEVTALLGGGGTATAPGLTGGSPAIMDT